MIVDAGALLSAAGKQELQEFSGTTTVSVASGNLVSDSSEFRETSCNSAEAGTSIPFDEGNVFLEIPGIPVLPELANEVTP